MIDPQLAYDSAQMRNLLDSPVWEVLARHLERMQRNALSRVMNFSAGDQETHHWRGVYNMLVDVLNLHQIVIEHERAQREAA